MRQLVQMLEVTRDSDGRRFYLVELGGTLDAPAGLALIDRDEEDATCEECGGAIEPGAPLVVIREFAGAQLAFHPDCAPRRT